MISKCLQILGLQPRIKKDFPLSLAQFWKQNTISEKKDKKLPETDVGAFWSVKKKIEFFGLFLHLFDLIGCQIHQAIDLVLKAFHSLLSKIDITDYCTAKRPFMHSMNTE